MLSHCHRDTPPGQGGVESSRDEPGAEKIPDFCRFCTPLLRREDTGDAGKIDGAESKRQHGCRADGTERQVTKDIAQGEERTRIVEQFKCQQSAKNNKSKNCPSFKSGSLQKRC